MKYYVVDAFAERIFEGNPAGVCVLDEWLSEKLMQSIAFENNLAETAFVVKREGYYDLRWFTPKTEIDLCGHATLASAFVICNFYDTEAHTMDFHTMSGVLMVERKGELYEMDFPSRKPAPVNLLPIMQEALGVRILEAHMARDLLLLCEDEQAVRSINPRLDLIAQIPDCFAVIATAKGESVDFVSRFFAPKAAIPEDPVTGSSHSTLIPFWAERLSKNEMVARQVSRRGGTLFCQNCEDRVKIAGKAVLYLRGEIRSIHNS